MEGSYRIIDQSDSEALAEALSKNGQLLLPMLELIQDAKMAVDQAIDVSGRATIQALLMLSAQKLAGEKHPGKASGDIRWHGSQKGVVHLAERQLKVSKPRLRRKGPEGQTAEVNIPVYEALQRDGPTSQRMLEILLSGVSTRRYRDVLPEMAQSVGISKSSVSRQAIAASEQQLQELLEKDLSQSFIVVIYLDGIQLGNITSCVRWAWIHRGISMCWAWRRGLRRMPRWSRNSWRDWCSEDWTPKSRGCS